MKKTYYYVPCDGGPNVNQEFRHYFRLYVDKGDGKPLLVNQGGAELIPIWEAKYPGVTINVNNPYPLLD
jgi:hypothetical protein